MRAPTTVEVLRGAKAALAERGWFQGWYFPVPPGGSESDEPPEGCPVCLLGALDVGSGMPPGSTSLTLGAERVLAAVLEERGVHLSIGPWNDEPGRTLDEVYALLDQAIERVEAVAP